MTTKRASNGSVNTIDQARPHLFHVTDSDVTLEDVRRAGYWGNIEEVRRRPLTVIEVIGGNGLWEALLRVVSYRDNGPGTQDGHHGEIRVLRSWVDEDTELPAIPAGYSVQAFDGRWNVVRETFPGGLVAGRVITELEARRLAVEHAEQKGGR